MAQTTRPPDGRPTAGAHPPAVEGESDEQRRARAAAEERQARETAEAATSHLPRPGDPRRTPLSPAEAGEPGEPTVSMIFATPVTLTLEGYRMVHFEAGPQDVPESLAGHPYLAQSGARRR